MRVLPLYAAVVLIWGSTWSVIRFQIGPVAEELSVAWRFALASALLLVFALVTRRTVRIPLRQYPAVVLQGALLFSCNYLLVYYVTDQLTTGLIAVVFSLIVVSNAVCERIFFKRPFEPRLLLASLLGMLGVACLFWPEVSRLTLEDQALSGMLIAVSSVIVASLGNMAAVINTRGTLSVVAVNVHAMAWGAATSAIIALLLGREFRFSWDAGYVWSLLYLAIFGSAVAFGCYLALIRRIGSARAAYTSVLFPAVALTISTVFEDYRWTALAVLGILLTMAGNWLALSGARQLPIPAATTPNNPTT